jgi:glutamyl-tRNA(Gln) amidotransferase subunit D
MGFFLEKRNYNGRKTKLEKNMKNSKAKPGDFVEISLMKTSYRGILLESPESGTLLLKLDSGYNIGLRKKEINEIKILKKAEEKKEDFELKRDKEKPNIAVVMTGGTISSELDVKTGAVKWLTSPEKLFRFYPEIFKLVNVSRVEVPFMKGSEYMNSKDWKKLSRIVFNLLKDSNIKGIIITHGTDTLHYTAAALSFFLKQLNKPVVLTYSQRSTDRASSDASLNLQAAALAAISDINEVVVVGHATTNDDSCFVLRGTKTRKLHSSKRDAFKPVNVKPIAKIMGNDLIPISSYRNEKGSPKLDNKFEDKVALVKLYPGQNSDILNYYSRKKYKGIVLELFGLGHVPGKEWISKLKELQKKGIVICATAQTIYGRLDPLVYSAGRELMRSGILFLEDMLAETALVKLGYVLGKTKDKEEIQKLMLENMAGEFNDRLEE